MLSVRSLVALAVAAAIAIYAAAVAESSRQAAKPGASEPELLFPALEKNLNSAARIEIASSSGAFSLERQADSNWGLVEKSNYPADFDKVKKALVALSKVERLEEKTSDPSLYSKLNVGSVDDQGANTIEVAVKDKSGKALASLVVGRRKPVRMAGENQFYGRVPTEKASWLLRGDVRLEPTERGWLVTDILDVERDRVQSISIQHPDGESLRVYKETPAETNFTVADIPEGKELRVASIANSLGGAIQRLALDGVAPAADVEFPAEESIAAEYKTFDGLVVKIAAREADGKYWSKYEARYEAPPPAEIPEGEDEPTIDPALKPADEVRAEVDAINKRVGAWAYEIPKYKIDFFRKRMADFVQDKPAPDEQDAPLPPAVLSGGDSVAPPSLATPAPVAPAPAPEAPPASDAPATEPRAEGAEAPAMERPVATPAPEAAAAEPAKAEEPKADNPEAASAPSFDPPAASAPPSEQQASAQPAEASSFQPADPPTEADKRILRLDAKIAEILAIDGKYIAAVHYLEACKKRDLAIASRAAGDEAAAIAVADRALAAAAEAIRVTWANRSGETAAALDSRFESAKNAGARTRLPERFAAIEARVAAMRADRESGEHQRAIQAAKDLRQPLEELNFDARVLACQEALAALAEARAKLAERGCAEKLPKRLDAFDARVAELDAALAGLRARRPEYLEPGFLYRQGQRPFDELLGDAAKAKKLSDDILRELALAAATPAP